MPRLREDYGAFIVGCELAQSLKARWKTHGANLSRARCDCHATKMIREEKKDKNDLQPVASGVPG